MMDRLHAGIVDRLRRNAQLKSRTLQQLVAQHAQGRGLLIAYKGKTLSGRIIKTMEGPHPMVDFAFQTFPLISRKVKAVQVHHLVPRRHEVTHELLLCVTGRIDLGHSPQLSVRAEHEIDDTACPVELAR